MMPAWHQLVSMSGHVEESETARKLQLYATSIYQVHSFVCQLDYRRICFWQDFAGDPEDLDWIDIQLRNFKCIDSRLRSFLC